MREAIFSVDLSTTQILAILSICAFFIWKGRVECVAAIFISAASWEKSFMFGPVVHTWIFMGAMYLSAAVYIFRTKRWIELPRRDLWIVTWMILWWIWMLFLIFFFESNVKIHMLRALVLNIVVVLPIILLFGRDLRRINWFILMYLVTTILGGFISLFIIDVSSSVLFEDPTLYKTGVRQMNVINYHPFAYVFGNSAIMAVYLFTMYKRVVNKVLMALATILCCYFLMLLGSRQSLIGVIFVLIVFGVWLFTRRNIQKTPYVIVSGVIFAVILLLYQSAPVLITRSMEDKSLVEIFDMTERIGLWWRGLVLFAESPIWGNGFNTVSIAHNLFVGTLVDQGLIGLVFFIGFLAFVVRQSRGLWKVDIASQYNLLKMCFVSIILFTIFHAMVSGNPISENSLYWSAGFLWWLASYTLPRNIAKPRVPVHPHIETRLT